MTHRPLLYDAAAPARSYTLHPAANWPRRMFLALLAATVAAMIVVGAGGCASKYTLLQAADEMGVTYNQAASGLVQLRRDRKIGDSDWSWVYDGMVIVRGVLTKVEDAALAGESVTFGELRDEFFEKFAERMLAPKIRYGRIVVAPATRPAAAPER